MKNHLPISIDPIIAETAEAVSSAVSAEELCIPETHSGNMPLVVCSDAEADAAAFLQMGWAVLLFPADRALERDMDAFARWLEKLNQCLDRILAENSELDADNLFIDGWPAAYAVFHSRRFRAAVQHPAIIDRAAAWGTCAAGWVEPNGRSLQCLLTVLSNASVLMDVDGCCTPLLIVHPLAQKQYPAEQSEILYSAMKDRVPDVPCRLAVFPECASKTRMLREITGWFCRFLQGGST